MGGETIYVRLLNENVEVRRPVHAERIRDQIYRISHQPYDREIERWEFEPDDIVVCEPVKNGEDSFLSAVRLVD
jgi:hypothetical protein